MSRSYSRIRDQREPDRQQYRYATSRRTHAPHRTGPYPLSAADLERHIRQRARLDVDIRHPTDVDLIVSVCLAEATRVEQDSDEVEMGFSS